MIQRIFALSLVSLCLAIAGCDQSPSSPTETTATKAPRPAAPDNTVKNRPDVANSDKTPMDQSQSQSDVTITAEIRRAIMKADGMSMNAQNCKIITENGRVTLRGPVNSQAEKDAIGIVAAGVPGVVHVDNLLEVKTTE